MVGQITASPGKRNAKLLLNWNQDVSGKRYLLNPGPSPCHGWEPASPLRCFPVPESGPPRPSLRQMPIPCLRHTAKPSKQRRMAWHGPGKTRKAARCPTGGATPPGPSVLAGLAAAHAGRTPLFMGLQQRGGAAPGHSAPRDRACGHAGASRKEAPVMQDHEPTVIVKKSCQNAPDAF
jgi:hypothetical protein